MSLKTLYSVALIGVSAIPLTGWSHWEGFEAADPTTPAAVLRLDSAAQTYTALNVRQLKWRALFADRDTSANVESVRDTNVGAGDAQRPPAQPQR